HARPGGPRANERPPDPGRVASDPGPAPAADPRAPREDHPPAADLAPAAGGHAACGRQPPGPGADRAADDRRPDLAGLRAPPPPATGHVRGGTFRIPVVSGGAVKIADNESPRPVDRIFLTYNFYDNLNTFGGRDFDVHREVFGFEKTFLGGDASFGLRVPVLQ